MDLQLNLKISYSISFLVLKNVIWLSHYISLITIYRRFSHPDKVFPACQPSVDKPAGREEVFPIEANAN